MSGKKRELVDYNWVDEKIISRIPTECIEKSKPLQKSVEQWKRNKESIRLPSVSCIKLLVLSLTESDSALAAASLQPSDVAQIFNLRFQEELEFEFADEDMLEVPIE